MRRAAIIVALGLLTGCTIAEQITPTSHTVSIPAGAHVLLFEPDIKYYLMSAGGVPEPQPDWTQAARGNFVSAARAELASQGLVMQAVDPTLPDDDVAEYTKLHNAVASTILEGVKLPSKSDRLDLGLGPGVSVLRDRYGADYGLFVFYVGYGSTGGRWAFAIIAAAAGVAMPTGGQGGAASLVDLKTGEIVWFNNISSGTGDLRNPGGAATTVQTVFKGLPRG
jgi:hypothetical protein